MRTLGDYFSALIAQGQSIGFVNRRSWVRILLRAIVADWERVKDIKAFLAYKPKTAKREHSMTKRVLNWMYCANCGLLALKNDATRKALKAKCIVYEE